MQLNESTLKTIADSIKNYFSKQNIGTIEIQAPFLGEPGVLQTLDYSGLIQIYGDYKGAIYYTASSDLLGRVADKLRQPRDKETFMDLIGEMSNIFAGNVREDLGSEFSISTPFTFQGTVGNFHFQGSEKPYVLPILFGSDRSFLVIYFERQG